MKNYIKALVLVGLIFLPCLLRAQITGILYKTNKWGNIEKYQSWTKAMDNQTFEPTEVLITEKVIKVKRGEINKYYVVISKAYNSNTEIIFKVTLQGKKYDLKVSEIYDSTYFKIEGLWMIEANNANRSIVELEKEK